MKLKYYSILFLLWCAIPVVSFSAEPDVRVDLPIVSSVLSTGAKLYVVKDPSLPMVQVAISVPVGSIDEPDGYKGASHVLEHMMFRGSKNYPDRAFAKNMAIGGALNSAYTTKYNTIYLAQMSKEFLPRYLKMEQDRFNHLSINANVLAKEKQVVKEERRMRVEDNPLQVALEKLNGKMYLGSPFGYPVIGSMADIDSLSSAKLRDWYQYWYRVPRLSFFVQGDVDPNKVKQWFEGFKTTVPKPSKDFLLKDIATKPAVYHPSHLVLKKPYYERALMFAFDVPAMSKDHFRDALSLKVLLSILDGREYGLWIDAFTQNSKPLATLMQMQYQMLQVNGQSQLQMYFYPSPKVSLDTLKQAVNKALERLQGQTFSQEQLSMAKMQLRTHYIFQLDNSLNRLFSLAKITQLGLGTNYWQQREDVLAGINNQDLHRVITQYLAPNLASSVMLTK